MIKILKCKLCIAIGAVILLIGVPFVIHSLFKVPSKYDFLVAEWTAGELLSYYGSILAFLGTVSLGGLALWQNHIIELKSKQYNEMLQQNELQKNMPKLICKLAGYNGNYANINILITNVSENIASRITASNFNICDIDNETIKTSKEFRLEKDFLTGGDSTRLSFINESLEGMNLFISFQLTCVDKYEKTHYYKVFGIIEDTKQFKLDLTSIEMGDGTDAGN